ncbi:MAG: hypothetical protein GDA41_07755 [Rhodospirillales bacterium]|nr:hypothetical protein [Rhodospirillales bacterium]
MGKQLVIVIAILVAGAAAAFGPALFEDIANRKEIIPMNVRVTDLKLRATT